MRKPIQNLARKQRNYAQQSNGTVIEYIRYVALIKGMGMEKVAESEFGRRLDNLKNINIKASIMTKGISVLITIINNIWTVGVLWIGGYLVVVGQISLGNLISFLMFSGYLYPHINSLLNLVVSFQQVKVSVSRFNEYYLSGNWQSRPIDGKINFTEGRIELKSVTFQYSEDHLIFHNLNYTFQPHQVTLISGKNGSGKTILCCLTSRLYENYDGEILIEHIDIRAVPLPVLRKLIKYLPQNEFLFSGTIRNNLCTGNNYNDTEIYSALKKVGLEGFVSQLPLGLDSESGEAGIQFSGAQAQRLALARLILIQPKIVIMDEPTAFVDKDTKKLINDIMLELKKTSTVIVVMHSNSIMPIADETLNLDDEANVEQGC